MRTHKTTTRVGDGFAAVFCTCRQEEIHPFVRPDDAGTAEALAAYAGKSHEARPRRFRLGVDARRPVLWPLGAGVALVVLGGFTHAGLLIAAGAVVVGAFTAFWTWRAVQRGRRS